MSLEAIMVVTAFLIVCFRSVLLADLNSSSSGRMSSTSPGGKQESGSLVSDMARHKCVDDGKSTEYPRQYAAPESSLWPKQIDDVAAANSTKSPFNRNGDFVQLTSETGS
jgi:hypothetical protein